MELSTPLTTLPAFKKIPLRTLERVGLLALQDLFAHFPHRYEDFSETSTIDSLEVGAKVSLEGVVSHISSDRSWQKKMIITRAILTDTTGSVRLVWFNQRFVAGSLREGLSVRVTGKAKEDKEGLLLTSPEFERSERDPTHTGRLVPIYPETSGLTSRLIRWQMATLFAKVENFPDPLPTNILQELHLPTLRQTYSLLHFPKTEIHVALAQKRLAFEEMFYVQLKALQLKQEREHAKSTPLPLPAALFESFLPSLPFTLTQAQKKAFEEISRDLSKTLPMNRLLNGDVGSGKTIVALLAALIAVGNKKQVVLLAPTEILARQHFESFSRLLTHLPIEIALFTGSYRLLHSDTVTRATMKNALRAGIPSIIIGTHALLQEDIVFDDLALIIVDEQHRFGVAQRAKLQDKSFHLRDQTRETVPHFLTMTATPIPRTLALAFFGSLSVSLLDELPGGRLPIETALAHNSADRTVIYQKIAREISAGRQAFIIFPLVEASLAMKEIKAATVEHVRLAKEIFPDFRIGLIHGKMKASEKETVMRDFKEKKYDILVATSVIEVGIDIPNASVILIEEADRFGLSQLHQFRGRVGRGAHQSYCFLIPGKFESGNTRLDALVKNSDGFSIAEADLATRGPGAFFGTRQSGLPDIAMENLTNMKLITLARRHAEAVLMEDPTLKKHPLLLAGLERFEERIHFE
jgi:ATP-dependent DNA helicase RecG